MKKTMVVFLLATLVLFSSTAYAKLVSGKVSKVNADTNTLTVNSVNLETGAAEDVNVLVHANTTYSGVEALTGLKKGDEVFIDVEDGTDTSELRAINVQRVVPPAPASTKDVQ